MSVVLSREASIASGGCCGEEAKPEAVPTGYGAVEEESVTKIIAKEKSQEPEMKPKKVEEHNQNKMK
jgi:hypothetical protein